MHSLKETMTPYKQNFLDLVALTKLYLLQEFSRKDWLVVEAQAYSYFKQLAKQNKPSLPPVKQPSERAPNPPATKPVEPRPKPAVAPQTPPTTFLQEHSKVAKEPPPVTSTLEPSKLPLNSQKALELNPLPSASKVDFSDVRKIIAAHFPHYVILDNIPDDSEAKRIQNSWKEKQRAPQAVILSFHEDPKQQNFLGNIAKAIQRLLAPAQVLGAEKIELENTWGQLFQSPELRLVIVSTDALQALPELQKCVRESPKQNSHRVGDVPLLLLSNIPSYFGDPQLKASLWKTLRDNLSNE